MESPAAAPAAGNPLAEPIPAGAAPAPVGNPGAAAPTAKPAKIGGRPRLDGLEPGSPEAKAADAAKKNKSGQFARRTVAADLRGDPAPLPAADPALAGLENPAGPAAGAENPLPGADFDPLLVNWEAADIEEITEEALKLAEESDKTESVKLATAGRLPADLIRQIEQDAEIPALSKKILLKVLPAFTAKKLNEARISAKNKEPAMIIGALAYLFYDRHQRRRTLEKLCRENSGGSVTQP